ncbi:hypothetical protein [Mycoplasmoides gallisepticum]|uniref:hypothetical protein n=1 Tax=Mycoplasmoides gallisepticum TaxID=2096 RepID=UPI0002DBD424|nr:hypothetical protein [Mycoplasmoides gallisepticum]
MKKTKLKYLFGLSAGLLLIAPTILSSCRPAANDKPPIETKPEILSFKDQEINPTPVTDAEVADVLATPNTPKEKVIKLFRDAAQAGMWNAAMKEFKNSESYNQGYRVKLIDKGVFDALSSMSQLSVDDDQVADIYYAPGDQITNLAAANQAMNLSTYTVDNKNIIDYLKKAFDLPNQTVTDMVTFGLYSGRDGSRAVSELLALQHNKEGIFIVSPKPEAEALKILQNDSTNTLTELTNNANALWFTQNFWYGLGTVGGVTQAETEKQIANTQDQATKNSLMLQPLIEKLAYWANNKASSGWLLDDPNFALFSKATDYTSGFLWKLYEALYKMTDEQYKQTPWGKKGIQRNTLETAFNSDGTIYLNTIYKLFSENQLDFGMVGTWELRNAITNGGVKSIFTVPDVVDGVKYLQSPGSWSWGIVKNKINSEANDERKKALINILLSIYSPNASYQYFLSDSKVPIFESVQNKIRSAIQASSQSNNKELNDLATELMYQNVDALLAKYNEVGKKINDLKTPWVGQNWETTVTGNNPLAEQYLNKKTLWEERIKGVNVPSALASRFDALVMDAAPLKNALTAIFGASTVKALEANQSWKLNNSFLKDNAIKDNQLNPELVSGLPQDLQATVRGLFDGDAIHFRRLENAILGYDGDGQDASIIKNSDLANELLTATDGAKLTAAQNKVTTEINEAVDRANKLLNAIAKTMPNAQTLKTAVTYVYYEFLNNALLQKLADITLLQTKMPNANNQDSKYTLSEVAKKVDSSSNASIVSKILDVITSNKSYAQNGTGIFETLPRRPGISNPQFGTVWSSWNERTFGNLEFFKSQINNITNEEMFKKLIRDQLSQSMTTALSTITQAQTFFINFGGTNR